MERLKPERRVGQLYPIIDVIKVHSGLMGEGILLEDLKANKGYRVASGIPLVDFIGSLVLSARVRLDESEDGPVLKYFDISEIEKLKKEREEAGKQARKALEEAGIYFNF